MGDFKKLYAWQKAQALARDLYAALDGRRCATYPGLRAQVLRAAASIPSNLAEGCAKRSRRELARFAEIAYASAKEVECNLILSRDVGILGEQEYEDLAQRTDEVAAICFALTRIPAGSESKQRKQR